MATTGKPNLKDIFHEHSMLFCPTMQLKCLHTSRGGARVYRARGQSPTFAPPPLGLVPFWPVPAPPVSLYKKLKSIKRKKKSSLCQMRPLTVWRPLSIWIFNDFFIVSSLKKKFRPFLRPPPSRCARGALPPPLPPLHTSILSPSQILFFG